MIGDACRGGKQRRKPKPCHARRPDAVVFGVSGMSGGDAPFRVEFVQRLLETRSTTCVGDV